MPDSGAEDMGSLGSGAASLWAASASALARLLCQLWAAIMRTRRFHLLRIYHAPQDLLDKLSEGLTVAAGVGSPGEMATIVFQSLAPEEQHGAFTAKHRKAGKVWGGIYWALWKGRGQNGTVGGPGVGGKWAGPGKARAEKRAGLEARGRCKRRVSGGGGKPAAGRPEAEALIFRNRGRAQIAIWRYAGD